MFSQPVTMDSPLFMVNENPVQLQHLCRMCAAPCYKSVPIFGPVGEENELASKFNNYLPLKVSENDTLPLQVCYECTNLLIQWDAAILLAMAADKKLRALLWREQQTKLINAKDTTDTEIQKKRKRNSTGIHESICCSICNKSGMDFRELVEHLKSHEESERSFSESQPQRTTDAKEDSDGDCTIDDLLTPVVCLETFDAEGQHGSKTNVDSKSKPKKSAGPQNRRGKRGRPKSRGLEGMMSESDDPIVTSSTSTPQSKPVEPVEVDNNHSSPHITTNSNVNSPPPAAATSNDKKESPSNSQNNTFKPKVRIISAESINQTLEERAKANQTAKKLESHQPKVMICSPPRGAPPSPNSARKPPVRLVLSGQVVKGTNPTLGQKFLKLSDGRIIKIVQNKAPVPTGPPGQQVHSRVGPHFGRPSSILRATSPDACRTPPSQAAKTLWQPPQVDEKQVRFTSQPGPKHCPNRYICGLCGKRNLTAESLQEHSRLHMDDETSSN